jgi:hypothetical protein
MRSLSLVWRALVAGAALLLMGHSPYRQWVVFRQTHLIVVAGGDSPGAAAVSEAIARALAAHVPRSRAMAAMARTAVEATKLLRSRQLPLGLLLADDAADAVAGQGSFASDGPLELRAVAAFGPYVLVALEDFPADKAGEIARALESDPPAGAPPRLGLDALPVPHHPGAVGAGGASPEPGGS